MAMAASHSIVRKTAAPIAVALLVISFVMPFSFFIAGLKLSGHRTILLIFLIPAVIGWLNGKAGKIQPIDFWVIGFALWAALTLLVNHGFKLWQFTGMLIIETLVPYFIARTYIRSLDAFRYFVRCYFMIISVLLPFALFEIFTDQSPLLSFFGQFLPVYVDWDYQPRLGLERAQATMPHPILFGVFCSGAFSLCWYVLGWGKSLVKKSSLVVVVGAAVFASLSSGAWLNVLVQMFLMFWNRFFSFFKNKWKVLLIGFGSICLLLEVASNRNIFEIFATHMTLTPGTAWARINTFIFASDEVMRNPVFGIGMKDWARPFWMLASVDNFWLVISMRHGFPGLFLLAIPTIAMFFKLGSRQLSGANADARLGYLIALCGLCFSAVTVHLWDATFCFFMFFLGAGVWFLDTQEEEATDLKPVGNDKRLRYTRFPKETLAGPAQVASELSKR